MKKIFYKLTVFILIVLGYTFWSDYNRAESTVNVFPRYVIGDVEEFGKNTGKGNIIALSPYLHTYDFSSKETFCNMLHYYLSFAQRKNLLNDSTIIVLPEYIGTWLVVSNEKRSIYEDTSLEDGMKTVVLSNLGKFTKAYLQSHSKDKTKEAIFRMKAYQMRDVYQAAFSGLAKEFHVTIVAGSVVLPEPIVRNGNIEITNSGKLYNVSVVFDANGKVIAPLTKKIFPIEEEKTFICGADKNELPVYKTAAGTLAVLICADSWYASSYKSLKNKNADVLAVPSFVSGNDTWSKKWKGYNGAAMPSDADKNDIGQLTEHDAWSKYAMPGKIKSTKIKTGVNVFLRGDLWNLGSDGHTLIWNNDAPVESKDITEKTGSLINVWL